MTDPNAPSQAPVEQDYYGTKRVTAWPSTRHWSGDDLIEQTEEGYAVRYADGYQSWSPKAAFEAAYKPITAMGLEGAVAALKAGHKVCRAAFPKVILERTNGNYGWDVEWDDVFAEDWMIVDGL